MTVREQVPLSDLTTLRVGGVARVVVSIDTMEDVPSAVAFVRAHNLPFVVLGEGSNVLASDDGYEGALLLMRIPGITFRAHEGSVEVSAGAGVHWDEFVLACAERGLWGTENLAGIPGTVGAAPVQNIGAYGMEVKQTISRVDAYDADSGKNITLDTSECGFGYRDSRFKHEPNLIITRVSFRLSTAGEPKLGYTDLTKAREAGTDMSTPGAIGSAVREIRSHKFPDLKQFGTAGSFFKNPILSHAQFTELSERYGAVPSFPQDTGVKVPLAFILDRVLALRGFKKGPTFLFGNQPLVLVADVGATANDVDALACEIETRVQEATGILIEREVRMLHAREWK